jgi:hypothetical protein
VSARTRGRAARWWARRPLAVAAALAAIVSTLWAESSSIVVEDWAKAAVGTHGVPPGWQGLKWGSPKYDFTVIADGAGKALELNSDNDSSTISKEIKVDTKQYPILEWRWKVIALPPRGDARNAATDDQAAQLYVTFPRFPTAVRSRTIGYIWDSTAPVGAIFGSAKVSTVTFVVVRSGAADLGRWISETRNVHEDYKRIYHEDPGEMVGAVSISCNSQNTGSRAAAVFGEILFRKP